ncbi:hypothetical protein UlMin_010639 [Ulmus minor]
MAIQTGESLAKVLRGLLEAPGIHQGPVCYDALSAKLVEKAGFPFCFTGGFHTAASRLGLPDCDLTSYAEFVDHGRQITEAVSIPVIGDADDGFGNAMNLKRTVRGYIRAGYAGIMLDDQVSVKPCGRGHEKLVASREESVMRIKAAVDARKESGIDIVILGRTDRLAVSLEEAIWRSRAFAEAGADVIFLDNLYSREEMKAFCDAIPQVPKLVAHMGEGGDKPFPTLSEFADIGYKLVAYPFCLLGVSIQAMLTALSAVKSGGLPPPGTVASMDKMKEVLGFHNYFEEEKRYALSPSQQ